MFQLQGLYNLIVEVPWGSGKYTPEKIILLHKQVESKRSFVCNKKNGIRVLSSNICCSVQNESEDFVSFPGEFILNRR